MVHMNIAWNPFERLAWNRRLALFNGVKYIVTSPPRIELLLMVTLRRIVVEKMEGRL